ncbi:hypothetical protein [Methylogaea oryzae]|uniref:hypothetical protein n=1 Tax=Methylogaea oryzae TaxID=1295382 RepID=UPI0006D262CD|nr:hypothetical protein [Methylogaea oryzae]
MTGWKLWLTLAAVAATAFAAGVFVMGGGEVTIADAVEDGSAQVSISGVDVQEMSFSVSATSDTRVVIPAGTLLASGAEGTQNMMTARTILVPLHGTPEAPDIQTVRVPVYCINRYLAAPTSASAFSLGSVTEETEPVQRLARCLENLDADHRQKQYAIWSVSDKFMNMSGDAFVENARPIVRSELQSLGPEGLADKVQREMPDIQPEYVAAIRAMSSTDLDEMFEPCGRCWLIPSARNST